MKALFLFLLFALVASAPVVESLNESLNEPLPEPIEQLGSYIVTAYCSCEKCCGQWASNRTVVVGAHGIELQEGVSVASPLPAGTVIDIEGIGVRVVHDKTADWIVEKYDGKIVDLYFDNHEEASRFGKHTRNVSIVSRGK